MNGIADMRGVSVIGTALDPNCLDPRVKGAGRFEIEVGLRDPNESERLEILLVHTKRKPLSAGVSLADLARETKGMNGAELENLCRGAAEEAMKEYLGKTPTEGLVELGPRHFEAALGKLRRTLYNESESQPGQPNRKES
jgi:transitional endoplasmic reticulum ATPase